SIFTVFLLQAEDGIRDATVTGVQTCALPIYQHFITRLPIMPVINGEASYEMLMDKIPAQWPRAMFWICMMNGAAGHTYGANGIRSEERRVGKGCRSRRMRDE